MIKDTKGSKEGWYWAEIWDEQTIDNNNPPFNVPNAGFGLVLRALSCLGREGFHFRFAH